MNKEERMKRKLAYIFAVLLPFSAFGGGYRIFLIDMRRRRKMFMRLSFSICLLTLALGACTNGPATVGEPKEFSAVCDKANDGKRVAVDGYLRFPSVIRKDILMLRLYKEGDLRGAPLGVSADFGSQANQVEKPPKQFTDGDLKVHLEGGQVARFGTKVRVSGQVYFPIVEQEFPCALSNPLVEVVQ